MTEERLMTAEEVAKLLRISARQVQKLAKRGDIPSVRVGDLLRFRPQSVEAYIRSKETRHTAD